MTTWGAVAPTTRRERRQLEETWTVQRWNEHLAGIDQRAERDLRDRLGSLDRSIESTRGAAVRERETAGTLRKKAADLKASLADPAALLRRDGPNALANVRQEIGHLICLAEAAEGREDCELDRLDAYGKMRDGVPAEVESNRQQNIHEAQRHRPAELRK